MRKFDKIYKELVERSYESETEKYDTITLSQLQKKLDKELKKYGFKWDKKYQSSTKKVHGGIIKVSVDYRFDNIKKNPDHFGIAITYDLYGEHGLEEFSLVHKDKILKTIIDFIKKELKDWDPEGRDLLKAPAMK